MKRLKPFIVLMLIFTLTISTFAVFSSADEVSQRFTKATIERVVDGDTVVATVNSISTKIRMIGVNTPESVSSDPSKNTPEGIVASNYTKEHLPKGKTIYLEYDVSDTDIYGRTLAYIWLTNDCDTTSYTDFCKYNYGAILMQNTYCRAAYYEPNGKYSEWYDHLDEQYQPYSPSKPYIVDDKDIKKEPETVNIPKYSISNIKKKVIKIQVQKMDKYCKAQYKLSDTKKFKKYDIKTFKKSIKIKKFNKKRLKKKKSYYIRVRAYKHYKNATTYSSWSKTTKITIKKWKSYYQIH